MNEEQNGTLRELKALRAEVAALRLEEALLRADRDRLRQLYQRVPLGYQSLDEDGCFLAVNEAWLDLLGYREDEVIGRNFGDFLHPDWQEHFRENFPRFKAIGEILGVEFEMLCRDGRTVTVAFDGRIGRDPQGRFQQTHCIFRDITARRAEAALRDAERRLLRICHLAGDTRELAGGLIDFFRELTGCEAVGIRLRRDEDYPYFESRGFPERFLRTENFLCERAADGEIVRDAAGNPVLECMCGNILRGRFDPELPFFTAGGSFWTNSTSELLAATSEADRQSRTRNRCNGEGYESVALIPFRLRDETFGLLQLNDPAKGRFTPEMIGQIEELAAYVSLSLSKHLADSRRQETEEKYRLLFERAQEGIFVARNQRLLLVNPMASRIAGLSVDELRRRSFAEIIHPEDLAMVVTIHHGRLRGDEVPEVYSFRIVTGDGRVRWVEVNGTRISWEGAPATLNFVTDITERRHAEEALRASEHLLNTSQRLTKSGGWEWHVLEETMTWTEETFRLHEFDPAEIAQGSPEAIARSLSCYRDEDRPVIEAAFRRCVEEGVPYDLEVPFTTCAGRHLWIRTAAEAVWADGRVVKVIGNIVDISEQHQALEELNIYADIVSSTPDGMAFLDTGYRYVIVNDAYGLYSGVAREQFIGRTVAEYLGEDVFREQLKPLLDRCLMGETVNYQREFVYRQFGTRYMDVTYFPFRNCTGAIAGIVVTTRDITEMRRKDEKLRESEAAMRAIFDAAQESIHLLQADGTVLMANAVTSRRLGVDLDTLLGRRIYDYFPSEVAAQRRAVIDAVIADGVPQVLQDERAGRIFETTVCPVIAEDGAVSRVAVFSRDVTSRTQAERQLRQQAMILDQISDAVTVTDLEGVITYINQASAEKLGWSIDQLIGHHVEVLGHDPEYGASQQQIVEMTLARGRWQGEVVNIAPDGRRILMDCRINTLFDDEGKKIGMCGISTDITEKRRTENLLQARLRLSEEASGLSMEAFMQLALDEAEKLTGSRIGFFHFLEADQRTILLQAWSTATTRDFCRAEGKGLHYGLDQAGVWADAIRQRQPLIHEDVPNLPGLRQTPSGHAVVERELVVPVLRGGLITAVLGVGNKPQPYDQRDVQLVTSLADMVWDILQRKQAEEALKVSEERFRGIYEISPAGIALADSETMHFVRANRSFLEIVGYSEEELRLKRIGELTHPDDWAEERRRIEERRGLDSGEPYCVEKRYVRKDGGIRWVRLMADYLHLGSASPLLIANVVDITDRRVAEEALRLSEERYQTIITASPLGIFLIKNGRYQYANPAGREMLGLAGDQNLIGVAVEQTFDAGSLEIVRQRMRNGEAGIANAPVELEVVRADGQRMSVESTSVPIQLEDGPAILVMGTDVTWRRKEEELLRARLRLSEAAVSMARMELLRRMIDEAEKLTDSRIGFFLFYDEGRREISQQCWSTATVATFCRASGMSGHYPLEQAGIWAEAIRRRRPVIHNDLAALQEKRKVPIGHAIVHRQLVVPIFREKRLVAAIGVGNKNVPYNNKDIELLSALANMAYDIFLRRQAEEELAESERKYRDLFETNSDSITIFRIGEDGMPTTFLAANTASGRLVGYSVDELLKMTPVDFEPDAGAETREERLATIARDGYARFETVVAHRDGRRIPVEIDVRPIVYEGRPALMNIAMDISDRKAAEAALQQSLAEKEVLLREVHHRVKNNMAAIIGLFEMQRQNLDNPAARTVLAELSSRVRAMSLVHEKLYRADALDRINFQEYLQAIVSHLRTSFGSPGIACEIDAGGIAIPLDMAVPCGMIVNELVTNALKYAFPEGRAVRDAAGDRILVTMERQDGSVMLTVADNGVGFAPGFDWRSVRTLGMVLVRTLGEHQLRGSYAVDGQDGARFTLTFPLRRKEAAHG